MKLLFTLLFICIANFVLSQLIAVDDHIAMYDRKNPVITFVKLKTGKVSHTITLKEKPIFLVTSENNKSIYAMTKHYAYKINGENGAITIEFQFQPILEQKATDIMDPNAYILPIGLNSNGVGFYFFSNELPTTLYKFDINQKRKSPFGEKPSDLSYAYLMNDKLYFYENYKLENKKSYTGCYTYIDTFLISEKFEIPINLGENDYNLTYDDIQTIQISSIKGDTFNILLNCEAWGVEPKESLKNHKFHYKYNLENGQVIDFKGYEVISYYQPKAYQFNQQTDKFKAVVNCPEKERIPKPEMEIYTPKRHNKKARAKAEKINDERLEQYERDLEAYGNQANDFSDCTMFIKTIKTDEVILEIDGFADSWIIKDKYILYYDGLEYIMYDISKGETIWTLMN